MLTEFLGKIRGFFSWSNLSRLARAPFQGGIQAAFAAWRDRWREPLPNDVSFSFKARSYPGSRMRRYTVHAPNGVAGQRPRPLVVVLHGCRQDNRDIEQISGFNRLAEQHKFLVAYPYITSYRGMRNRNCWGWWFDREIHAGEGEVEDLWQIVEEIKQQYPVDPRRIHVTGLSSGAGMAVAMMVAHADKIASGAAVAGIAYAEKSDAVRHDFNQTPRNRPVVAIASAMKAEMGDALRAVPILIVHSKDDDKVDINSAYVLRDSWGYCFGFDTRQAYKTRSGRVDDTLWVHSQYRDEAAKPVLETLFLEGPGHGWYGGNPGDYSFPDAPDIKQDMWKFFASQRLK